MVTFHTRPIVDMWSLLPYNIKHISILFSQGMPYKFGYKVYDPHHGTDFGQNEHSDGDTVKGQYQVVLPDGRLQQVTYTADWKTGYHADVQYHGKATEAPASYSSGGHELTGSQSYELSDHGGYTPSYSGTSEHGYSGY